MKLFDKIRVDILRKQLLNNKKKLSFINDITIDDLLYRDDYGTTLFENIIDYKASNNFSLSLLNIDFYDDRIIPFLVKSLSNLSEEDFFIKCKDKFLIEIIYDKSSLSSDQLIYIIKSVKNHYMEILDFIAKINEPELIQYFQKDLIDKIKENKDAILDKYKDKYYIFESIVSMFNDRQMIIDACKKYNREFLLNNIFYNPGEVVIDDNIIDSKQESPKSKISDNSKKLLDNFCSLFSNADSKYFYLVYNAFFESLSNNNLMAQQMIEKLIEIKCKNPEFEITFNPNNVNRINQSPNLSVNFNPNYCTSVVIFHEFAHIIHYCNNKMAIQYDISNKIEELRANPSEIKEKYDLFKEHYLSIIMKLKDELIKIIDDKMDTSIKKYSDSQVDFLDELNIEEKDIQKIRSISNYERLFFAKKRNILFNEYIEKLKIITCPELVELSDIFDAIFLGEGNSFCSLFGHGTDYFSSQKNCISEIIADFTSIQCLPDCEQHLELVRDYLGEELFAVIESGCEDALGYGSGRKTMNF